MCVHVCEALKCTALCAVSVGVIGGPLPELPARFVVPVLGCWLVFLRLHCPPVVWRCGVSFVPFHLQVGAHAVVPRPGVAEVDDAAFVRALIRWLHAGQAQLVGDVAAGHFHHLEETVRRGDS